MKSVARRLVDLATHVFVLVLAVLLLHTAKIDMANGQTLQAGFPIGLTLALLWLQAGMIKDRLDEYAREEDR